MRKVCSLCLQLPFALLVSCDKPPNMTQPNKKADHISVKDITSLLSSSEKWEYSFDSRRGKAYGMDSDSSLTFRPNGRITLTEFGYAVQSYEGIYTIDSEGAITAEFARYNGKWPKMTLKKDDDEILLYRADDSTHFEFGGRAGGVETSEMTPFWPFGLSSAQWYTPKPPDKPCPCCGYVSVSDYDYEDTCLVCFWRTYGSMVSQETPEKGPLDSPSYQNQNLTLRQARENFAKHGTCDPTLQKFVIPEAERSKYKRIPYEEIKLSED